MSLRNDSFCSSCGGQIVERVTGRRIIYKCLRCGRDEAVEVN